MFVETPDSLERLSINTFSILVQPFWLIVTSLTSHTHKLAVEPRFKLWFGLS